MRELKRNFPHKGDSLCQPLRPSSFSHTHSLSLSLALPLRFSSVILFAPFSLFSALLLGDRACPSSLFLYHLPTFHRIALLRSSLRRLTPLSRRPPITPTPWHPLNEAYPRELSFRLRSFRLHRYTRASRCSVAVQLLAFLSPLFLSSPRFLAAFR